MRNIVSSNNLATAKDFYTRISNGGQEQPFSMNRTGTILGVKCKMADGYWVSYRQTSKSDGTPVVQISIIDKDSTGQIKKQKIHFVQKEKAK